MQRHLALIITAALVAAFCYLAAPAGAQDTSYVRGSQWGGDALLVQSRRQLAGTWTCAAGSRTCSESAVGTGNGNTLSAGDHVVCVTALGLEWGWTVSASPAPAAASWTRDRVYGSEIDALPGVTAGVCWEIGLGVTTSLAQVISGTGVGSALWLSTLGAEVAGNLGVTGDLDVTGSISGLGTVLQMEGGLLDGTLRDVETAAGTDSALSLSTTTVGAAALEVGGAYSGGSGATISSAGVGQFNGAVTSDGALTAGSAVIGGGSGGSGSTLSTTGTAVFDSTLTTGLPANQTAGAGTGGGVITTRVNTANGVKQHLVRDTYNPTTGQSSSEIDLVFSFRATSDSGTTYADEEGFSIQVRKDSDFFNASGEADNDARLYLYLTTNGTPAEIASIAGTTWTFPGATLLGGPRMSSVVGQSAAANQVNWGTDGFCGEGATADTTEGCGMLPVYAEAQGDISWVVPAARSTTNPDVATVVTIDPYQTQNMVTATCDDAGGCTATWAETGTPYTGQVVYVLAAAANTGTITHTDQAGILDIPAATIVQAAGTVCSFIYTGSLWAGAAACSVN